MRRLSSVVLTFLLGLLCIVGSYSSDATAQQGDKKPKLPTYWTKLKLSAEQKDKIQKVQIDYGTKIDQLKKQLEKMEKEERQEMFKFLSDNQKEELRKIYKEKTGIDPFAPPSKDDPKKDPEIKKDPEKK
jgi:hypothetical protein